MAKRIIDGKTYNTETSTEIAAWDNRHDVEEHYGVNVGEQLYRNRYGAFFKLGWADDGPEGPEQKIVPLTPEEAKAWLIKWRSWDVDLVEKHFGKMPEAGQSETRFTVRIPDYLADRLKAESAAKKQSINALIIRLIERGVEDGR